MPSNFCIICKKQDSNLTLQCDGCENYLHVGCIQIDTDDAKRITRQRTKGVKFFCDTCNRTVDQFTELKLMLKSIEERISGLEHRPDELPPQVFENLVRETKERIQRENNVIIYGVPENLVDDDVSTVESIFKSVGHTGGVPVQSGAVTRLGVSGGRKPRPIRVVCSDLSAVRSVLKHKNKLRDTRDFKNIYINRDETLYQRNLYSKCKESLRSRTDSGETGLRIKYVNGVPTVVSAGVTQKN